VTVFVYVFQRTIIFVFKYQAMSIPLEHEKIFHVFNRGNNKENIFTDSEDYTHFLQLYSLYIQPIADTYAWCLMKNHFHFCIRIKDLKDIGFLDKSNAKSQDLKKKWEFYYDIKNLSANHFKPSPDSQLKLFFNAYAMWFNARHNRSGSLFKKNCNKKLVDNMSYLADLIVYINNNPIKHGFENHPGNYSWSSYNEVINDSYKLCDREIIKLIFEDDENFKHLHSIKFDDEIEWGDFE
jgi:REP element-mobilizing transposase RayT